MNRLSILPAVAAVLVGLGCSNDDGSAASPDDEQGQPTAGGGAEEMSDTSEAPERDEGSADGQPEQAADTPDQTPGAMLDERPVEMVDPNTPLSELPESCRGFDVVGLEYSPGGSVLPNTCAPFHRTLNNPYAIRCVDADPSYDTGWPGDEMCILPPHPDMGTQVVVSPPSYDAPGEDFIMAAGEEITDYYFTKAPNTEEHFFYRVNLRMRAGSHHMINRMIPEREDGWSLSPGSSRSEGSARSFPGSQRPDQDRPHGILEIPEENKGLGARIEAHQQFSLNLHHFNFTDGPTLREVWVNIWYEDEITDEIDGIAIFGNPADLNIPPGEHRVLHYACDVPGSARILALNGHRHAHTARFGVWLERGDQEVPLYESFDYNDMPTYNYDSISDNPIPDRAARIDGAYTGILEVEQGDRIHFVCDVTNSNDTQLRFANEVQTGEMCILFGQSVGDSACGRATRIED